MNLKVCRIRSEAKLPTRAHQTDAGIDLYYCPNSEKKLYNDPPDFVILFSWHIASELKLNLKKRGFKGKFIIPLPYPKIES